MGGQRVSLCDVMKFGCKVEYGWQINESVAVPVRLPSFHSIVKWVVLMGISGFYFLLNCKMGFPDELRLN
ncbi:calcineurin B-like protein 3 [Gossypium australe]|uniref:Calcineurin B-like protein 3 n=1 Tax=Gossypium australe TaxID=47621 RepID=A0A5B6X1I7_9ROSI|nr:calcineurin B-like protein 3 [Gossypium australe]